MINIITKLKLTLQIIILIHFNNLISLIKITIGRKKKKMMRKIQT